MAVPNRIDPGTRVLYVVLSSCLLLYGTAGIVADAIYVPGKRTTGTDFHGEPAWILYAAMVCASANMLSVVVDHYDTRDNEVNYRRFATVTQWLGWGLFVLALVLDLLVFRKGTRH